jgi:hypothetical protein
MKKMLRTPNTELRTISVKNSERSQSRTPNAERNVSFWLDEALLQVESSSLRKVLFGGEGVEGISSYVAGWMVGHGIETIVLDGANRFDPYIVSSFARKVLIPPEDLLHRIRIARAFTCYQMATLMGEKLASLLMEENVMVRAQKPLVILLGPLNTFLDEDVPEREVSPLLERSLRKVESLTAEGIPFFLFQSFLSPHSRRYYLMRKLFQFSNLVWRISLDDEGPKLVMEKGLASNDGVERLGLRSGSQMGLKSMGKTIRPKT